MSDKQKNWYQRQHPFAPYTRAEGEAVAAELDAIQASFERIPEMRDDGKGFKVSPVVPTPTEPDHAVPLKLLSETEQSVYRSREVATAKAQEAVAAAQTAEGKLAEIQELDGEIAQKASTVKNAADFISIAIGQATEAKNESHANKEAAAASARQAADSVQQANGSAQAAAASATQTATLKTQTESLKNQAETAKNAAEQSATVAQDAANRASAIAGGSIEYSKILNVPTASTTTKGIAQLTNDTGLDSENLGLSAKGGKKIAQSVAQLQQRVNDGLDQKVNKTDISDVVNSESRISVASSKAVKTAYDKGVEAKEEAKQVLAELRNLQIGARNLIKNSRLLNGTQHWTTVGRQSTHNGVAVFGSLDRTQQWYWRQAFSLPESEYTFSALVKPEGTTYYLHVNNGTRWADYYARGLTPGVWQPVSILIRSAISMITFANHDALAEFSSPMLVEGNRATSWTPAPEDAEDYNRQNYVAKSGDKMTGNLILDNATSLIKGQQNGQDDWFVGRVRSGDNEIALASYKTGTSIHLKNNRIDLNSPIYRSNHLVFDENNLTPVRSVDLRSSIPNATVTYQNATPAQLPMGGYVGITTNSRLAGVGTYTGIGQFVKAVGGESYRFGANNGRFFSQTGNSDGWGRVCEHMMVRPELLDEDLNNVTDYGIYAQKLNERTTPARNYPVPQAGTLFVTPSAYGAQQEYTSFLTGEKFVRGKDRSNTAWAPWRKLLREEDLPLLPDDATNLCLDPDMLISRLGFTWVDRMKAPHQPYTETVEGKQTRRLRGGSYLYSRQLALAFGQETFFISAFVKRKSGHGRLSLGIINTPTAAITDVYGDIAVEHTFATDEWVYIEGYASADKFDGFATLAIEVNGDLECYVRGVRWQRVTAQRQVSILTGEIAHGGTLPIPAGFSELQCRFFVSMKHSNPNGRGWDWNENAEGRHYRTECHSSGRTVTCRTYVSEGIWGHEASPLVIDGIANYLVIGVK